MNQDKRIKKLILYGLVSTILVIALAIGGTYYYYENEQYPKVEGIIHGDEIDYTAGTDGKILEWLVDLQGDVKAGTSVVKISSVITKEQLATLEKNYQQAKTEYENMEKNVQSKVQSTVAVQPAAVKSAADPELESKIALAKSRFQQIEVLKTSGAVSQREYEKAQRDLAALEAQRGAAAPAVSNTVVQNNLPGKQQILNLAQAQIRYQELKRALEQVKGKANDVEIHSPITGRLVAQNFKAGEDFSYGDKLFTVDTGENPALYIKLTDKLKDKIHSGQYVMYNIKGKKVDGMIESVKEHDNGEVWAKIVLPKSVVGEVQLQDKVTVTIALNG